MLKISSTWIVKYCLFFDYKYMQTFLDIESHMFEYVNYKTAITVTLCRLQNNNFQKNRTHQWKIENWQNQWVRHSSQFKVELV